MYLYYRYIIIAGIGLMFLPLLLLGDILQPTITMAFFFLGLAILMIGASIPMYYQSKRMNVTDERIKKIQYKGIAMAFSVAFPIFFLITYLTTQGILELSAQQIFWIFAILIGAATLLFQTYYKRKGDIE